MESVDGTSVGFALNVSSKRCVGCNTFDAWDVIHSNVLHSTHLLLGSSPGIVCLSSQRCLARLRVVVS